METTEGLVFSRTRRGLTLAELLVALMVTSIVLAAAATLAYAMGTANDVTDDTAAKQMEVRFATLRISELVRHCKLVCGTPGGEVAIWRADSNGDRQININELVYIQRGTSRNYLRLCEFPSSATSVVKLSDIATLSPGAYSVSYVPLIRECSNVEFMFDASPPNSRLVNVSFDLAENGVSHRYQISAALRGWAGPLLNASGEIAGSDDD